MTQLQVPLSFPRTVIFIVNVIHSLLSDVTLCSSMDYKSAIFGLCACPSSHGGHWVKLVQNCEHQSPPRMLGGGSMCSFSSYYMDCLGSTGAEFSLLIDFCRSFWCEFPLQSDLKWRPQWSTNMWWLQSERGKESRWIGLRWCNNR